MNVAVVVDVGNTRVKWGRCEAGRVAEVVALPPDAAAWGEQYSRWRAAAGAAWVLTGVQPRRRDELAEWLRGRGAAVAVVDRAEQLPLRVAVEHPDRVGIDRLLDAVAVNGRRAAGVPAVVVDAGSAVTVDWLDEDGAFRGGAILPGLGLMARALHDYTALLPLVALDAAPAARPGGTTRAAMGVGIFWAVAGAVRTLAEEYGLARPELPPPELYLAGGDAALLREGVGPGWVVWPEITLEGVRRTAEGLP